MKNAQNTVKRIRDDIKKKISELINSTFSVTPEQMLSNIQGCISLYEKVSRSCFRIW